MLDVAFERALLIGESFAGELPTGTPGNTAQHLILLLQAGAFGRVLHEPLAARLLETADRVAERACAYIESVPADEKAEAMAAVRAIGSAALCLFTHVNWSGALISEEVPAVLSSVPCDEALAALQVDGEAAYALLERPELLCVARALLVETRETLCTADKDFASPWWAARCLVLHQRCLDTPSPSLERQATRAMRAALAALEACADSGADPTAVVPLPSDEALSGRRVMVVNLEGRPELNGQRGVAGAFDTVKGRYATQLDGGGSSILLKADNLVLVTSAPSDGGAEAAGGDGWQDGAATGGEAVADKQAVARVAAWGGAWREAVGLAHMELAQLLLIHRKCTRLPSPWPHRPTDPPAPSLLPTSYFLLPTSYFLLPTSYFLLPTSYFFQCRCRH